MKKKMVALLLIATLLVSAMAGCGKTTSDSTGTSTGAPASDTSVSPSGKEIKDLVMWAEASKEASTLILINSEKGSENFASNFTDGWLTNKSDGSLDYLLADRYESNADATEWVFHLRDDVTATWVDYQGNYKADVTVQDWITAAEYILNFWKNDGQNASMLTGTVAGASEYYEYTKNLPEAEALALGTEKFDEVVAIKADPQANTVTYTCFQACPYFYTLAAHKCTLPLAAGALEEIGVANYNSANYDQLWYCGPYTMTSFISGNEKVLEKNPAYWNIDNVKLFDSVTIKMIDSLEVGYQLYENGEIDQIELNQSLMYSIINDSGNPYYDYLVKKVTKEPSTVLQFNYAKNQEDGTPDTNWNTAISNSAFRMSIYYGLDLESFLNRLDPVNPYSVMSYTVTHGKVAYTTDGTDYRDLVIDKLGLKSSDTENTRYNADEAQKYKQQAIEELTAQGVTFPVQIDYYVSSGSQTDLDTATVLKQVFESSLGDDYVSFNIKSYISSANEEVYTPSLQSVCFRAWGQDFGDPVNSVGNFINSDTAIFTKSYTHFDKATGEAVDEIAQFTQMVRDADAIVDVDGRLNAFAEAEAYLVGTGLVCPVYLDVGWELTKVNDYSMLQAGFGSQGSRYVNWETNSDGYTTEQFAAFRANRANGNG